MSLDLAAALCNMSSRTLQRKPRNSGTHSNEVLGLARFRVASRMLQNPDLKVNDIAKRLGYSGVAHFARAFRRIAGVTPSISPAISSLIQTATWMYSHMSVAGLTQAQGSAHAPIRERQLQYNPVVAAK